MTSLIYESKALQKLTIYCPNGEHGLVDNGILARNVSLSFIFVMFLLILNLVRFFFLYMSYPGILNGLKLYLFIKHFFHVSIFCGFLSEVAMMLFLFSVVICNGEGFYKSIHHQRPVEESGDITESSRDVCLCWR